MFLKDVPKQTLYDLMKYIYCGEVNVMREHLDEFLNTAKSLQIKGLIDDQNLQFSEQCQSTNLSFPATEMPPKPATRGFQYQSTSAAFRAAPPTNMNTTSFSIYPAPNVYGHQRATNGGNVPETKVDTHISDENCDKDQFYDVKSDLAPEQVKNGPAKSIKRTAAHTGAPTRKRVKRNDGKTDSLSIFDGLLVALGSCGNYLN